MQKNIKKEKASPFFREQNYNELSSIIYKIGVREIARNLDVSATTVSRWARNGSLPYTDYTEKTKYWKKIKSTAANVGINISKKSLLSP